MAFHSVLKVLLCFLVLIHDHYLPNFVRGQPQVPCHFIFGDSLADPGNNNKLFGVPKANYPPYGVDFANGPTGRFTNGRTIVDIIGQLLGLTDFTPPFTELAGVDIFKGVNYASGGSGIRNDTGRQLGEDGPSPMAPFCSKGVRTFSQQLADHLTIYLRIFEILGDNTAARNHLGKCIYTIITGNNDYINNYFQTGSITSKVYTPQQYANVLASQFDLQLRILYYLGARKVAVFGVFPVGNAPQVRQNVGDAKVGNVNGAAQLFNDQVLLLVNRLNAQLPGAKFTFINSIRISQDVPQGLDLQNPCCKTILGFCRPASTPCANRLVKAFYDGFHPTEVVNVFVARRAYKKISQNDAFPYDIRQLAQL